MVRVEAIAEEYGMVATMYRGIVGLHARRQLAFLARTRYHMAKYL